MKGNKGKNLGCRHASCPEGLKTAEKAMSKDEDGVIKEVISPKGLRRIKRQMELIPFGTTEKPNGRYVDSETGDIFATNTRNDLVYSTGQNVSELS